VTLELEPEALSEFAHETRVAIGFLSAEFVVHVQDYKPQFPVLAQPDQRMEQGYGIRTARNGDADAVAARKHSVPLDCLGDSL
jgi:hypothetical protein